MSVLRTPILLGLLLVLLSARSSAFQLGGDNGGDSLRVGEAQHYDGPRRTVHSFPPLSPNTVYAPELKIPRDALSQFRSGAEDYRKEKYEDALEHFRKAHSSYPTYSSAFAAQALTLMKLNKFGEAYQAMDQALALNPGNLDAVRNLGLILLADGRMEESKLHLQRVVAALPHDVKSRLMLACIALLRREHNEVLVHANAISPQGIKTYPVVYMFRGRALEYLGRNEEAVENYKRYLTRGGNDPRNIADSKMAIEHLTQMKQETVISAGAN